MQPGQVLADRFEIERLAGSGGMAWVFRARDLRTGAPVALKLQQPGLAAADQARLETEARVLAGLRHPHIVRYLDHGVTPGGEPYLAMEWLEGEDLAARLARARLTVVESVALGRRVAEALGAAHARGIVHRDLKPSNIFLAGGAVEEVKLLDFGVARLTRLPRVTRAGAIVGTLGYMAPEQARGNPGIDARADIFALGAVLFECVTGTPAFASDAATAVLLKILFDEAPRLSERCPHVPEALEDLVARMLARDPSARPADGARAVLELAALGLGGGAPRSQASRDRAGLTRAEQRLLGVVLVAAGRPATIADVTTAVLDEPERSSALLRQTAEGHGARLEIAVDGSIAATLAETGPATDLAAQAARCALALRALVPGRPMAITMGRGEIGGRLPVGEAIERAARLLRTRLRARGAEPPGEPLPIAIDEVTAGLLDARFEVASGAAGRELRGEREGAEGTRTLLGRPTPCVGREREIALLQTMFEECTAEPAARAALVTAGAGVGKSRLRQEVLERLRTRGEAAQVWMARGDPARAGAPFELLGQMIRRAARLQDGEPVETRRRKLLARVARRVPPAEQARVAEFLGEMVGTSFPDEHRVQLRAARQSAILLADQMRLAWADFIEAECRAQPLILVLEDLHWGDLPTVEYVDTALRRLRDQPLLVLALARPEVHERFPRLWAPRGLEELRLRELPRRACEQLVRQALGERVGTGAVARLLERAAGNAFVLEELVRAEAEGRGDEVPETVLAMVQSRLERLAPEARRLLRAGSIFGQVFWRGAAAALLGGGGPSPAASALLGELEDGELIAARPEAKFQGEREYLFRHALVREAAYGMLTAADRQMGHRLAGEWLERMGETEARVVAEHFELGGEPARAVGWYRRAAEQALGGNDLEAALGWVERGLLCGATGEELGALVLIRAEAQSWRGLLAASEPWAIEATRALPEGSARWYAAVGLVAWAAGALGHADRLAQLADRLLGSWSAEAVSGAQAMAAAWTAVWLFLSGDYARGEALCARIEALSGRFPGEPAVSAMIASARATSALFAGDTHGYRAPCEAAIRDFEQAGDRRNACRLRVNLGSVLNELGAFAEARELLRLVLADAERTGLEYIAAVAMALLSVALTHAGDGGEARAFAAEATARLTAQGNLRMAGNARVYLAALHRRAGDLEAAEAEARRAAEELATAPPLQPLALATLAEVRIARGRPAEALAPAQRAAELLEVLGKIEEGESFVRLVHAEALAASGDQAAARAAIAVARERLLARAARIADPAWRESFLERVPHNARTLALARCWLGE